MIVFQVGVNGVGVVTAQPARLVERHRRRLADAVVREKPVPRTVPRLRQTDEHRVEAGLVERHVELLALMVRHERIRAAVQDHAAAGPRP